MQAIDYLRYIVEQIHSTVFATVDAQGRPVTCAIDMMDCDEDGLYFLTAKGKSFYRRLQENGNVAFTAIYNIIADSAVWERRGSSVRRRFRSCLPKTPTWRRSTPTRPPAAR